MEKADRRQRAEVRVSIAELRIAQANNDKTKLLDLPRLPLRNTEAPDVPTMTESGVPGLEIESWIGLFAPAKTPPAIITRLQAAIAQSLPELKQRFETVGGELMEVAPDQLNGIIKADYDRWITIIREAGIRLE
jgi:tripartite-type tricarboxylate transporter receptor subunit TctC